MPSSLAGKQEPIICGDIEHGIDHDILKKMQEVNVISCSTEECTNCPVAKGCSYCTAYNYEVFGTINKRVINICIMHKATSLINTYFYNKIYKKHNLGERLQVHLPEKEALKMKIQYEGMTVGIVDVLGNYMSGGYVQADLIRNEAIIEDSHQLDDVYIELTKGVYM